MQPTLVIDLGIDRAGGDLRGHVPQRLVQVAGLLGQQRVRGLTQLQVGQRRGLRAVPFPAREQLRTGVAPASRGLGIDLAALEVPVESRQDAEHPRATVDPASLRVE